MTALEFWFAMTVLVFPAPVGAFVILVGTLLQRDWVYRVAIALFWYLFVIAVAVFAVIAVKLVIA